MHTFLVAVHARPDGPPVIVAITHPRGATASITYTSPFACHNRGSTQPFNGVIPRPCRRCRLRASAPASLGSPQLEQLKRHYGRSSSARLQRSGQQYQGSKLEHTIRAWSAEPKCTRCTGAGASLGIEEVSGRNEHAGLGGRNGLITWYRQGSSGRPSSV